MICDVPNRKGGVEVTVGSVDSGVKSVKEVATLASRLIPLSRNLTLFGRMKVWVRRRWYIKGLKWMSV